MENRVAILSWYNYDNYGTVLQAYALEYIINKLGYEAYHIDYTPYKSPNIFYNENIIKESITRVKQKLSDRYIEDERRKERFDDFRSRFLRLTDKCVIQSDFDKLNRVFSIFVTGSDQIWSPFLFDDRYFLDFVRENNKKIAYAPSLGVETIPYEYLKVKYQEYLADFDCLSVREKQGSAILSDILKRDVTVVMDPVFLLSKDEWNSLIPYEKNEEYILAYFLGNNKNNIRKAKKYAKACNKKLKIIPIFKSMSAANFEMGVGPIEFLGLIKGAYAVLTDSFHGVAFSLVFRKEFFVFERFNKSNVKSQNSRIYNILDLLGLESRLVHNDIDSKTTIDYNNVSKLLRSQQEQSISFLSQALNSEKINSVSKRFYITKNCCGCGACSMLCPQSAISMSTGAKGFIFAEIDFEKCIYCQKCVANCPMNDRGKIKVKIDRDTKLFSYVCRDVDVLKNSSSGGISYDLAINVLRNGGQCLGAVYDYDKNEVIHKVITQTSNLSAIQGSKYLQSDFINGFSKFLNSCNSGIVFGTPCQIAAARQIMISRKIDKEIFLVDLICHGVPSKLLWNKYLFYVIGERSNKCKKIVFRDKKRGWHSKYIRIETHDFKYEKKSDKDLFYHFFDSCLCNMQSCFECPFREGSYADLRIGDFWGNVYKSKKNGVNECLVITDKGYQLLNCLSGVMEKRSIDNYFNYQQISNYTKPAYYDCILDDLKREELSLDITDKKYNHNMRLKKIIGGIYHCFKK